MYVLYACLKRSLKKPPEHTSEHVKSQNFQGRAPRPPLTQCLLWAPLFLFALGPHNPLTGPVYGPPNLLSAGFSRMVLLPTHSPLLFLLPSHLLPPIPQHAARTLGSGNLKLAVQMPEGEDINEWIAVNSECQSLS